MSMLLIKGSFHISAQAKPDGDTIGFIPDYVGEWKLVHGKPLRPSADGHVNVRLEAIDALETHYPGANKHDEHQPLTYADAAADELLDWLGFVDIQRHKDETVSVTPDRVAGYILTRGTDSLGRCVALVGRGRAPGASGYEIDVDDKLLAKTANYHLLSKGLAYPTFYQGFPQDLRRVLTNLVHQVQAAAPPANGLWSQDATTTGAKIVDMKSINTDVVILPKLFRRLKDYLDLGGDSLACFPSFLAGANDVFTLPDGKQLPGLHSILEITNGQTLRLTHPAEDLLFEEK
ncbi:MULTISPECIES: nuclease [unclassified Kitasatospora]|uniref:nuclease n=1 Tax=unclassified Kitasatospora TaxID=2633591 RepID=UPI001ADFBCD5|nr:nuclease [Kitasatospora sp. RG8]MBP0452963.1 nuclease [Kitasatospora sp. RG8]